jgi:hypothetical protein
MDGLYKPVNPVGIAVGGLPVINDSALPLSMKAAMFASLFGLADDIAHIVLMWLLIASGDVY